MRPDSGIHWNAYPALLAAGMLALGIVLAFYGVCVRVEVWAAIGFFAAIAGGLSVWRQRARLVSLSSLSAVLAASVVFVAVGGARYAHHHQQARLPLDDQLPAEGADVAIRGRVVSHPATPGDRIRFLVEVDSIETPARPPVPAALRVQTTLYQDPWGEPILYPEIEHGDYLKLYGRLRGLPERTNPADYDYGWYLQRQGIHALLSVRGDGAVRVLASERRGLTGLVTRLRGHVHSSIELFVPSQEGRMVLKALLLGDRSDLAPETREQFVHSGLMHLLAVSGLHVLLVGMVLYSVLGPFLRRLRLSWEVAEIGRAVFTLAVLGLYMLVSGAAPSVVRAVVMAAVLIGATLAQRSSHTLNSLGVAAIVLLVARPAELFNPGFQLSFAAVAAIVTLQPIFRRGVPASWHERTWLQWSVMMVVVSAGAVLGTLPVLLYHFGITSFAGIVLNIIAIPLTAGTLAAGLLTVVLGPAGGVVAAAFGAAADLCARALLWIAEGGDTWLQWTVLRRYVRCGWLLAGMTAGLVMIAQWPRPRLRWRLAIVCLSLVGVSLWGSIFRGDYEKRLDVVFLEVGHGDAALVSFPSGRDVLIDAGRRDAFVDIGRSTILPHLHRYGIGHLDAVIISHPHADHFGGLPTLLREVSVGRVIHNGQPMESELYEEKMHLLDSLDVPHQPVSTGDTLVFDPDVRAHVLAPLRHVHYTPEQANDASVVLRLAYGETSFLFMGDAETLAEGAILQRNAELLPSDVIKIGHHGSSTSSTPALVEAVIPDSTSDTKAIVSVGAWNIFGLPSEDVLHRWEERGAEVYVTGREGAIWLRSDGQSIERIHWR